MQNKSRKHVVSSGNAQSVGVGSPNAAEVMQTLPRTRFLWCNFPCGVLQTCCVSETTSAGRAYATIYGEAFLDRQCRFVSYNSEVHRTRACFSSPDEQVSVIHDSVLRIQLRNRAPLLGTLVSLVASLPLAFFFCFRQCS